TTPASLPLTFRQVLDLATAQNLELAAVQRARAVREADVKAAGQWANPDFSAEITKDVPHGDLSIGWPVDIGGVRSKRIAVARAGLAMADIDEANALRQMRRDVRLAFHGLLATDEAVALAESVVGVAKRVKEVAQARFEEGAAPRLDVMEAELGVVRAQTDLDMARSARRATQADLNALLNRPPGMSLALAGEASDIPAVPTLDRATAMALATNVDLLAIEKEAALETTTLSLLKAERVPTPTFSFGTALDAPGEFNVGPHAGVSLALPLFSRNQGEIAGSLARADTIRARRDALRRQVEARVFAAVERVTARRAQVDAFRATVLPTATTLQGLAEESYRLGRDSILAALVAQRALRDVKYEYLQALLTLQEAVADLEDILGAPIQ
ncbi:MAG: TolC family protein, partial [Acidobacteria bacterium]|nr:TolC family protein [Acidobacteriota bacterium]